MGDRLLPGVLPRLSHVAARVVTIPWRRVHVRKAFVSFTFDDFPQSAAAVGAALLEEADARGTFYTATGLLGSRHDLWRMATDSDLARLDAAGHEIGWHTHDHRLAWQYDRTSFRQDFEASAGHLREVLPHARFETFAYPYGIGCILRKHQLRQTMRAARSVRPGINRGAIDPHFLRAYPLSPASIGVQELSALIAEIRDRGGWLIFYTHDVSADPSPYGTTPQLLAEAIRRARQPDIHVLPVAEVLDVLGVPPIDGMFKSVPAMWT